MQKHNHLDQRIADLAAFLGPHSLSPQWKSFLCKASGGSIARSGEPDKAIGGDEKVQLYHSLVPNPSFNVP
jgi:hypothetical protein